MHRLLLVVEDAFAIAYRGVIVIPLLPPGEARRATFRAELRRPDGSRRTVTATATASYPVQRSTPPAATVELCLVDAVRSDVPVGTEIWGEGG